MHGAFLTTDWGDGCEKLKITGCGLASRNISVEWLRGILRGLLEASVRTLGTSLRCQRVLGCFSGGLRVGRVVGQGCSLERAHLLHQRQR